MSDLILTCAHNANHTRKEKDMQQKAKIAKKDLKIPSKRIYVVDRPMNDWMPDDILVLKALRRKYESLWRKTRLTVHFDMYSESSMAVKKAISKSKFGIIDKVEHVYF